VAAERGKSYSIEDVFLHVKLTAEESTHQIMFVDDLMEVIKKDLLRVVDDIVKTTHAFPRAENHIARSDKTQLWDIPLEDEVYVAVKEEVEGILDKNLRNVSKVTAIYQKFAYLLTEREKVEAWTNAA